MKKDEEGGWTAKRVCIDYRTLNKRIRKDRYTLHRPDDIFDRAGGARLYSKVDLRAGFHQIPIDPASQGYTAFWWRNQLSMYARAPFGVQSCPAIFQRIVDYELHKAGCAGFAMAYIDDIIVWSDTPEEHAEHLDKVLRALHDCGLRAHPDKSVFGADCIEYLGHNISAGGLSPNDVKIQAIRDLRPPTTVAEVLSVLGFMGYYRCLLPAAFQRAG